MKDLEYCKCCARLFFKLDIHHINGNHSDDREKNKIKVCRNCHYRIHRGIPVKIEITSHLVDSIAYQLTVERIGKLRKKLLVSKFGKDIRKKSRDLTVLKFPLDY